MITEILTQLGYRVSDARQLSQRVWQAWHTEARCWHCLKFAQSAEHRYGIGREAHWLQRLHSAAYSSCAAYLGHYQLGGSEVLVTEWLDGGNLSDRLRGKRAFHVEFSQRLYFALQKLHQLGICHGDIKPSNILYREDGPVLIDFASALRLNMPLTELEYRSYSPSYSLPALQQGKGNTDPVYDWYSLIVMLHVFRGVTPPALDRRQLPEIIKDLVCFVQTCHLTDEAKDLLAAQVQRLPEFCG